MEQGVWVFPVDVRIAGKVQRGYIEIPYATGEVEVEELDHDCQGPDCFCWKKEKEKGAL